VSWEIEGGNLKMSFRKWLTSQGASRRVSEYIQHCRELNLEHGDVDAPIAS
jgi:hypothetical protein